MKQDWATIDFPAASVDSVEMTATIKDGSRNEEAARRLEEAQKPLDPKERERVLQQFTVTAI